MRTPARRLWISVLVMLAGHPCRGSISVNWLDEPTVLWSEFASVQTPLDMNVDGIDDFTFSASISFVGVRAEDMNQYLVWPNPPPMIGGNPEPLPSGHVVGQSSGEGALDWFGTNTDFSTLIRCLSGSGGYTCSGRFADHHAYMGVEFDIVGATHYGWIDLLVAEDNPYAEIYGWAYETEAGVPIIAGAVPEPSTIILFTAGATAILLSRRKKRIR